MSEIDYLKVLIKPGDEGLEDVVPDALNKGIYVEALGDHYYIVPYNCSSDLVEAGILFDDIANENHAKVCWLRNNQAVILYKEAPAQIIADLKDDLNSTDKKTKLHAIWKAQWMDDIQVVSLLVQAVKEDDDDEEVLLMAQKSLAEIGLSAVALLGGEDALPILQAALKSTKWRAPENAALALGVTRSEKAYPLLIELLGHEDDFVQSSAVEALGFFDSKRIHPYLEKALKNESRIVRGSAVKVLGRIGGVDVIPLLEKAMEHEDEWTRKDVIEALEVMRDDRTLHILEKGMRDPEEDVSSRVSWVISEIPGEKILSFVDRILDCEDLSVRMILAESLEYLSRFRGDVILPLIQKALKDSSIKIRRLAVKALENIGNDTSFELISGFLDHEDAEMRANATWVLMNDKFDEDKVLVLLEDALEDKVPLVREKAIWVLSKNKTKRAIELFEKILDEEDEELRSIFFWAVASEMSPEFFPLVEKGLDDSDEWVRESAARALEGLPFDCEESLGLAEKALSDDEPDIRVKAVEALRKARSEGAFRLLEEALEDNDSDVREEAVDVLVDYWKEKALPILHRFFDDGVVEAREMVAKKLSMGVGEGVYDLFEKALNDKEEDVQLAAISSLGSCFELDRCQDKKYLNLVEKAVALPDVKSRKSVVETFGKLGGDISVKVLRKGLGDSRSEVRITAIDILAEYIEPVSRELLIGHLKTEKSKKVKKRVREKLLEVYPGDPEISLLREKKWWKK